jgi:hypothetical protein
MVPCNACYSLCLRVRMAILAIKGAMCVAEKFVLSGVCWIALQVARLLLPGVLASCTASGWHLHT